MEGAIMATQGAAIQHQINYTRANEFEADGSASAPWRAAGYDPLGHGEFFRVYVAWDAFSRPRQCRSVLDRSPIFSDRVAEARNRAEQIGRIHHEDSLGYQLTRERLRSVVGDPRVVRDYYASLVKNGAGLSMEQRYGKDVADINMRNPVRRSPICRHWCASIPK